jgi:hypothetical protein
VGSDDQPPVGHHDVGCGRPHPGVQTVLPARVHPPSGPDPDPPAANRRRTTHSASVGSGSGASSHSRIDFLSDAVICWMVCQP